MLLLLSLAACSSGKQATATATATSALASNVSHAPHNCPRPPCNLLPPPIVDLFAATASNTEGDTTYLDNPSLLNGNPTALIMVSEVKDQLQAGTASPTLPCEVGVWYNGGKQRWGIFAEDGLAMPPGTGFSVYAAAGAGSSDLLQRVTAANSGAGDSITLENAITNNNPNLQLVVTPNYNPGGIGAYWDNHPLGVWYHNGHWNIFHEDQAPFVIGAAYNVHAVSDGLRVSQTASQSTMIVINNSSSEEALFVMQDAEMAASTPSVPGVSLILMQCAYLNCQYQVVNAQGIPPGAAYNILAYPISVQLPPR
jgi:hypothetical protein